MDHCKKCGAPIVWIRTRKGKWMPCNDSYVAYKQTDKGQEIVVTDEGDVVRCRCEFFSADDKPTGMAREPHWATCPFAEEFKGKRS